MKKRPMRNKRVNLQSRWLLAAACLLMATPPPWSALAQSSASDERVELNMVNTEISAVLKLASRFTGRQFLVDPRVKGSLTLTSDGPVTPRQAYDLVLGALRLQGYTVVDVDGMARVLPQADAKLHGGPVDGRSTGHGGELVTRTFQLNYENATNMVPVLRPMITPDNPITAYPGNNTLVITDYADNLQRIAQVIARIDSPSGLDFDVIKLQHGVANDIAETVSRLLEVQSKDPTAQVLVAADPNSNSIVLRASSPARARLARELIAKLDAAQQDAGSMHVVYLRNAQAAHLANVLRGLLTGQSDAPDPNGDPVRAALGAGGMMGLESSARTPQGQGGPQATQPPVQGGRASGELRSTVASAGQTSGETAFTANGVTVQADASTNALIISAPEPTYRNLRKVIDQLDQRRAQVLVESLIVEVTETDAAQLGIQWFTENGRTFGGARFGATNINPNASTTIDTLPEGFSLGVFDGSIDLPGIGEVLNLRVLANALQSRDGANILSTPNLMTLDNEPASIMVGQTIPFVTGRYVTNSGDGSGNPFQTVQREDVGLKLSIRPQISEGGAVKLDIYQEVSSVDAQVITADGFVTKKRALDTSVLLDDGQIMVLGGLLEDSVSQGRDAVPGLSRIPLLGGLFRSENRTRTKTNLMVFLRPHVLRDQQHGRTLTQDRYDFMRYAQGRQQPDKHWLLPDMQAPILPPVDLPQAPQASGAQRQPIDARRTNTSPTLLQEVSESATQLLQFAIVTELEQAQQAVARAAGAGIVADAQRSSDGRVYVVRTRVPRDPVKLDAAVSTLRGLGYRPELVVEP